MPVSDRASAIEDAAKVSTFEASAASEMARSTASGVGTAAHRALPRGIGRAGRPGLRDRPRGATRPGANDATGTDDAMSGECRE